MLIRQEEVRKWLNGESFICGGFRFCYVLLCWRSMSKTFFLIWFLFSFLICKIDFEFGLHLPRIFWNKRFINYAKIDIWYAFHYPYFGKHHIVQSLKTPKIYAHMLIQFQDHVKKYSQTDEPPNTPQYTRPQKANQRWTNRTDNEYRYYCRNDQFQVFKCFMLFTSDSKNGPT